MGMKVKKHRRSLMAEGVIGAAVMAVLAVGLVASSTPLYKKAAGRNRPVSDTPLYKAGTYEGSARGYAGPVNVALTVSDYAIEDVKIEAPDETPEIGKTAAVQLEKQIWLANTHSVDSVSGATMTSNAVKKALSQCIREAAREGTELRSIISAEIAKENEQGALPEVGELLQKVPDGAYTYKDEEPDGDGSYNTISVIIEANQITSVTWDVVDGEGVGKRELSKNGSYIMTDHGPLWHEQADALGRYVVEHQTTDGLMDESGTTDAIASVSIHIGGFVDSLKKCLLSAGGDVSRATVEGLLREKPDGVYHYLSPEPDENGFRDQIDLTIKDHRLLSLTWNAVGEDGAGKRELSMEGKYVMTEDGPLWYEQADSLAGYVLEHQSESGMIKDDGYASDAVASVSIYAGGFVDALKKCLAGN